jgi:transcriptional regulator GlxA family with amidase domain
VLALERCGIDDWRNPNLDPPFMLPTLTPHRLDDVRLRRVLAYIEEHLAEDISICDLANVACLSMFHFTRAFAATMGCLHIATSANGGWRAQHRQGRRLAQRDRY